jgi:hypothetical protein
LSGWGIYVLDAEGNQLAMFNSATPLPGIDKGLQLLALGPRRVLAVGSFGEHNRAWCGVLELDEENKPLIRVFHEAKRVPDGRPREDANADPQTTFVPSWIHRFQGRDGSETALVGRSVPIESGVRLNDRHLAIDLKSWAVSVCAFDTRGFAGNDSLYSHDGHLLHASSSVYHCPPREDESQPGDVRILFGHPFNWHRQLLPCDGWIYVPGLVWRRIRPGTWEVENLLRASTVLPHPYRALRCGVSAHYGLIGYRHYLYPQEAGAPVLFQITIADSVQ